MGQKQLISFARALAFDPALLILDEATSSIDTETEQLIQQAIERVMRNRTSIVVAHRLSTIQRADQIIVLHHGEIREQGTHQELLAERGLYWRLYKLQYADGARSESQELSGADETATQLQFSGEPLVRTRSGPGSPAGQPGWGGGSDGSQPAKENIQ